MTLRPILFSAPMIRALLDGKKTQTRRIARFIEPIGYGRFRIRAYGGGDCDRADVARIAVEYAPYQPGDVLWVRETWADTQSDPNEAVYRADGERRVDTYWRPSIHMPRWASRITLAVKDVRVQQLQEISEADALAEGVNDELRDNNGNVHWTPATKFFARLWNTINGKRPGCAWEDDPWVVALTFDVHRMNVDAFLSRKDEAQ